jgi:hypothetical protein
VTTAGVDAVTGAGSKVCIVAVEEGLPSHYVLLRANVRCESLNIELTRSAPKAVREHAFQLLIHTPRLLNVVCAPLIVVHATTVKARAPLLLADDCGDVAGVLMSLV